MNFESTACKELSRETSSEVQDCVREVTLILHKRQGSARILQKQWSIILPNKSLHQI